MKKRTITDKDLFRIKVPTSVSISPNEKKVAFTVEWIDSKENKYYANIHLLDIPAGKVTQFTHGNQNDSSAVWSPDGSTIAFLSSRDKKMGIYLMPTTGGAERKLIEIDGSIAGLQWTPDGKKLVLSLRYNDSHFIEDEKKKKEAPVYRHVTRLFYRLDGSGHLPQDRFNIYTLDIASTKLNALTKGKKFDNVAPAVSPDGKTVVYVTNRQSDPDVDYLYVDLFVQPITGGKERRLNIPYGPKASPKYSPNGKYIAYIGHDDPEDPWGIKNEHVWLVSTSGKFKPRDLMPKFDRMTMDQSISDLADVHDTQVLFWSGDSKRIYFNSSNTGANNTYYIPFTGGRPTQVFKGKCHVKGLSLNGKGGVAAIIYADLNNPGDIVTFPAQYGGEKKAKKHTDLNKWLRTDIRLAQTNDVMFKSFDGTEVLGFLVKPPYFNRNKKYPGILEIHGGPRAQYAYTFFHEMQLLAASGYVVFYTNPRGGAGQGETWAAAIAGGWGDIDYKDCMAAADYLEKLSYVNSNRLGVTGGSYGGYMTNWIIGHTNRFKAAVTQRSVVDLFSFLGSSDVGFTINREFDGYPWTNPENYKKCSPLTYFKNVKTPILILHNEQDLRCDIEQARQMFVKLKLLKKKVEMVHFPEEPHGLSRHGRPDRRLARLNWILKWFKRYL